MYLDIHSHILHNIDDGAADLSESLALISDLYNQGVTDIIATPHFYPTTDNLEDFLNARKKSFNKLKTALKKIPHPNIYLGCELLYYNGISLASSLESFAFADSKYILIEPPYDVFSNKFFSEILALRELGFEPILAHFERYKEVKGFRKLLSLIKKEHILTQVNASSFLDSYYDRLLKKLVNDNLISFVASDTHSVDARPPMIKGAFEKIEATYGKEYSEKLSQNSKNVLLEITKKETKL